MDIEPTFTIASMLDAIGTVLALAGTAYAIYRSRSAMKTAEQRGTADTNKVHADASGELTTIALSLIEPYTKKLGELDGEIALLHQVRRTSDEHTRELEAQILTLETLLAEYQTDVKYQSLFGVIDDAALLVDSKTYAILDINKKAEDLWGYSKDEALTMSIVDLAIEPELVKADIANQVRRAPTRFTKNREGKTFVCNVIMSHFTRQKKSTTIMIFNIVNGGEPSVKYPPASEAQSGKMDDKIKKQDAKLQTANDDKPIRPIKEE